MIAADYAKALYALGDKATLPKLKEVLARRGHLQLLPRIYAEYQKLLLQKKRLAEHTAVTPERERNRILLELYHKLIRTN